MTTGQLIFYSGIFLLVLTIIAAIVFLIKKPKYVPQDAACGSVGTSNTQLLRNSYPTEYETIHQDDPVAKTELVDEGEAGTAAVFTAEEKEILSPTEKSDP